MAHTTRTDFRPRRGGYRRDVHRLRHLEGRPALQPEGPLDPSRSVAGDHRRRRRYPEGLPCRFHRPRHDRGHQCPPPAQGRARGLDHDRRLRGRPGHRPADPPEPVRAPAREPVRAHSGRAPVRARAKGRSPRGGSRSRSAGPRSAASSKGSAGPGAEAVAVCLLHSYVNPENEEIVARELERSGLLFTDLEPAPSRAPRIRADRRRRPSTPTSCRSWTATSASSTAASAGPSCASCSRTKATSRRPGPGSSPSGRPSRDRPEASSGRASWPGRPASPTSSASTWAAPRRTSRSSRAASGGRTKAGSATSPSACPSSTSTRSGPAAAPSPITDRGGSLRVGPQSAGADPGPACYGKGDLPAVTDANLCLGRLDPEFFLGGRMKILPGAEPGGRLAAGARDRQVGRWRPPSASWPSPTPTWKRPSASSPSSAASTRAPSPSSPSAGRAACTPSRWPPTWACPRSSCRATPASCRPSACSCPIPSRTTPGRSCGRTPRSACRSSRRDSGPWRKRAAGTWPRTDSIPRTSFSSGRSTAATSGNPTRSTSPTGRRGRPARPSSRASIAATSASIPTATTAGRSRSSTSASRPWPSPPRSPSSAGRDRGRWTRRRSSRRQKIHTGRALREGAVYDRSRLGPGNAVSGPALVIDPESTTFLPPGYRARVDGYLNLVIRKAARR